MLFAYSRERFADPDIILYCYNHCQPDGQETEQEREENQKLWIKGFHR